MKSAVKPLCFLCVLCGSVLGFSLDREAFSITNYDLNLQIEPEQHRLGVRGKITLRNDTPTPQKIAVLQISSSLDWRAIRAAGKMLQFVTQPYTSDIDHTGSLSEAIVTLPQEVGPHATIDLDIAYEGVVLLDATRLTRIGTPEDAAKSSDWDQIDEEFTGLRGAGYVAWYPIATEVANLSEGDSPFEVVARWKQRQAGSTMHVRIGLLWMSESEVQVPTADPQWPSVKVKIAGPVDILLNGVRCEPTSIQEYPGKRRSSEECNPQILRLDAPTLVIAQYQVLERRGIEIRYLKGHDAAAAAFADTAEQIVTLITDWFGAQRERSKTAELPDRHAAPFESGALLLTPLASSDARLVGLTAAHQLTHASFLSFRRWIEEGLAHFAQALYLENQNGRQAALDYMGAHRSALTTTPRSEDEAKQSLVDTTNEQLYRSKAMCVWWMLRDMVGDSALKKAIAAYKPEQDNDPTYMPRLIAAQTQRDLQWFFDDWVYRDRGLPDFKVQSAFAASTPTKSFLLTITLDNLGTAGAEVPVAIRFAGGEVTKRIEVRAKSKATFRVETPAAPQEIRVNDGSVPESDMTNNTFKVDTPQK